MRKASSFTISAKGERRVKERSLELSVLYDFYGALLTDKQRAIFAMYYNEDLSLSEIAENEGITRQGVRDALLRASKTLEETEEKLGLCRRYGSLEGKLGSLEEIAGRMRAINREKFLSPEIDDLVRELLGTVRDLREEI